MSTLSVSLTPGYLLQDGELLTAAIARLMAQPTITLEGDLGSASITDGSVTTVKLADGVLSADATGLAKMADGYLTLAKLASGIFTADTAGRAPFVSGWLNLALVGTGIFTNTPAGRAPFGAGLMTASLMQPDAYWYAVSTGSGSAYVVAFSPTLASYLNGSGTQAYTAYWEGLELAMRAVANSAAAATLDAGLGVKGIYRQDGTAVKASDILANTIVLLRYNTTFNSGAGGWQLLSAPQNSGVFSYTAAAALNVAKSINTTHGLGQTPQSQGVLVCTDVGGEAGYSQNDEVDLAAIGVNDNAGSHRASAWGANSTNVFATMGSSLASWNVAHKSTGADTAITTSKWTLKVYAWI